MLQSLHYLRFVSSSFSVNVFLSSTLKTETRPIIENLQSSRNYELISSFLSLCIDRPSSLDVLFMRKKVDIISSNHATNIFCNQSESLWQFISYSRINLVGWEKDNFWQKHVFRLSILQTTSDDFGLLFWLYYSSFP